jgi:hypothetical protein
VLEAVLGGELGVPQPIGAVHRLQKEVLEVEPSERFGFERVLRNTIFARRPSAARDRRAPSG